MTEPVWFTAAKKELGIREVGNNMGPDVRRYVKLGKCGAESDPWCAIFANAMLESTGNPGTRSAMARSFENNKNFVKLKGPALGAIVTFWRGKKSQGFGHVGFYNGEKGGRISVVGANQSDMVKIESFVSDSPTFGLVGYYWPAGVPLPTVGALPPQAADQGKGTGKVT